MRTIQIALAIGIASAAAAWAGGAQQSSAPDTTASYARDPANVPKAIAAVRSGDCFPIDVEMIARAHATEAIPDLEKQFTATQDPETKGKLASALVRLGIKDGEYWNYLVETAGQSLKSAAPGPFSFDQDGKAHGEEARQRQPRRAHLRISSVSSPPQPAFAQPKKADQGVEMAAVRRYVDGLVSQGPRTIRSAPPLRGASQPPLPFIDLTKD